MQVLGKQSVFHMTSAWLEHNVLINSCFNKAEKKDGQRHWEIETDKETERYEYIYFFQSDSINIVAIILKYLSFCHWLYNFFLLIWENINYFHWWYWKLFCMPEQMSTLFDWHFTCPNKFLFNWNNDIKGE